MDFREMEFKLPVVLEIRSAANSIFNNDALGIDLGTNGAVTTNDTGDPDTGPNNLQNFPVLVSLSFSPGNVTVNGTLNSLPIRFDLQTGIFRQQSS